MTLARRRPILTTAALFCAACVQGTDSRWDPDVGGAQVVTSPARTDAPVALTLDSTPSYLVGGTSADLNQEFDARQGYLQATPLSDGGLAVIDVNRVVVFRADGTRRTVIGREGAGPQEFRYLTAICATRGDTVIVNDLHNGRVGVLDLAADSVLWTFLTPGKWLPPQACFADGTFLVPDRVVDSTASAVGYRVHRTRTDGTVVAELGTWLRPRSPAFTEAPVAIAAMGQHLHVGRPQFSEVRSYDENGVLVRVSRFADPVVMLSAEEIAERGPQPAGGAPAVPTSGAGGQEPFFAAVWADPAGRVWVQDPLEPGYTEDGWTALNADGKVWGRLVIPRPPRGTLRQVIGFTADGVILRGNDAEGAATVGVYRLIERPGSE